MGSSQIMADLESRVQVEVNICVIGNCHVGKSSLTQRFTQAHFSSVYSPTSGVDYDSRIYQVDGSYVKVHLYDVSGEEGFLYLAKKHIKEADGFVFMYDVGDRRSFEAVQRWHELVKHCAWSDKLPKVLVGNKSDVKDENSITYSEAKEYAISENMELIECSSLSGKNISVIFYILVGNIQRFRMLGCGKPIGNPEHTKNTHISRIHEDPGSMLKMPENDADYTHMFKIMLLGHTRVGKTALRMRFCRDHYTCEYMASAGLDFSTRTLLIDGEKVKVQMWDVSGDEVFNATRKSYYKGANAFVIVYDVTSQDTFEHADRLLKELNMYGQSDSPKVVVASKCDLSGVRRKVDSVSSREWADGWRIPLIETSALTGSNVDGAVTKLVVALTKQLAPWKKVYNFS